MSKALQLRCNVFALAVPISFYVTFFGTIFMGFCPGFQCWPHTFARILLTPCLLLAFLSLRVTALVAILLLAAHVFTDVHFYGLSVSTLWGTDMALDKLLWVAVSLLVLSALLPKRIAPKP